MQFVKPAYAIRLDDPNVWPIAGKFPDIASLVSYFVPLILLIGGIVFFGLIVLAGFGLIAGAGGGDAHADENRKQIITFAVIGLAIMFGAFWILQIISYVTGGSLNYILGK